MEHHTVYSASETYQLWSWDLRSVLTLCNVYY